jgi:hypothetical protein
MMINAKDGTSATVMPWDGVIVSNTGPSTGPLTSVQTTAAPTSPTANHLLPVIANLLDEGSVTNAGYLCGFVCRSVPLDRPFPTRPSSARSAAVVMSSC